MYLVIKNSSNRLNIVKWVVVIRKNQAFIDSDLPWKLIFRNM